MTQKIIALVGLSGVGKTTSLRSFGQDLSFQHLQASALIRDQIKQQSEAALSADALRLGDIDENQRLLVVGFHAVHRSELDLIVLDGHTVIDTPNGLTEISSSVFSDIGVTEFVFIAEEPSIIFERRLNDVSRSRPVRSAEELRTHQEVALLTAFKSALTLQKPLTILFGSEISKLRSILQPFP